MTMKVGVGLEQAEKAAARLEAAKSGPIAAALAKVDGFIGQHGVDGHAVGGELTVADLFLFSIGTAYVSGTFDGIPEDLFATYPNIEAVRRTVSTHPAVAAYYADRTDEGSQYVTAADPCFLARLPAVCEGVDVSALAVLFGPRATACSAVGGGGHVPWNTIHVHICICMGQRYVLDSVCTHGHCLIQSLMMMMMMMMITLLRRFHKKTVEALAGSD